MVWFCGLSRGYSWTLALFAVILIGLLSVDAHAQEPPNQGEELPSIEVDPPERTETRQPTRRSPADEGAGDRESRNDRRPPDAQTPARGRSDGAPTPQDLARVDSAVSVIRNRGISTQGRNSLPQMLQSVPGLVTPSTGSGAGFESLIIMRGFSQVLTSPRVAMMLDGQKLNQASSFDSNIFFYPEMIDRIEVTRGDSVVPFGNKGLAGAINVIYKKPRDNPGFFCGAEAGSWHMDREWAGVNIVKGDLAAGIFVGAFSEEGFRVYQGNGIDPEPIARPGPVNSYTFTGQLNWRITPKLSLDLLVSKTNSFGPWIDWIDRPRWERRDTRDFVRPFFVENGDDKRWDLFSIGKLIYEGGCLGNLEIAGTFRHFDRRLMSYGLGNQTDNRWQDFGLSFKYQREDGYAFVEKDLTLGSNLYDGRTRQESRLPYIDPTAGSVLLAHGFTQSMYRESISYYLMNRTTLWDRLSLGLGYRIEHYDLRDMYANAPDHTVTHFQRSMNREKSASQWSIGLIYDKELRSSVYFKHSRSYRFPEYDEILNIGAFFLPPDPPFFPLEPEEGTQEEVGLRHWFTRNIYFGITYYEIDMDNEILYEADDVGRLVSVNVRDVSHSGVEIEGLFRITPRWTLRGNYTRQKVIVRSNMRPDLESLGLSTEDKWVFLNPAEIYYGSLEYVNKCWGFSLAGTYHQVGSQMRGNDIFNTSEPLEPAKWGDIAMSQTFFDGLATLYFGIKNITDRQYALWGWRPAPYRFRVFDWEDVWYPAKGRTYYMGLKSEMAFDRMKLPSLDDLERMNRRLKAACTDSISAVRDAAQWTGSLVKR
ncbi:TonB-dependent receptor [Thermodesulfobacteriota bacterium]